jgi:two-component system, NarL family, invasion response regulator UvrY
MKVLIVDDHAVVRTGLRQMLVALMRADVIEAANGRDALTALRSERPELVILDLNLPGTGGLELLRRVVQEDPPPRVLVLSMHTEPLYATRALQAGASGYVSKNAAPEELLTAIQRVAEGDRYIEAEIAQDLALQSVAANEPMHRLSARDLEILRFLVDGRSLTEIADALGLGYKTIANTCTQIKVKLGVTRTADLVRVAIGLGVS